MKQNFAKKAKIYAFFARERMQKNAKIFEKQFFSQNAKFSRNDLPFKAKNAKTKRNFRILRDLFCENHRC